MPDIGDRVLKESVHRLYGPLYDFSAIAEAIFSTVVSVRFNSVNTGSPLNLRCGSFPYVVWIAFNTLLPIILQIPKPTTIIYRVDHPPTTQQPRPKTVGTEPVAIDLGSIIGDLLNPFYVSFFETHKNWIKLNCGGDTYAWPPIFNFARVVRNALAHNVGRIHFENVDALPVTWHHVSYSPSDNGTHAISAHGPIATADLLLLMFEMSDELDRLGCPLNPP
jgi:hypothetical protein